MIWPVDPLILFLPARRSVLSRAMSEERDIFWLRLRSLNRYQTSHYFRLSSRKYRRFETRVSRVVKSSSLATEATTGEKNIQDDLLARSSRWGCYSNSSRAQSSLLPFLRSNMNQRGRE